MPQTLTLPSTRVVTAHVEVVRDLPARRGTDPEFDRLRELHAVVHTKGCPFLEAVVAEADEINRLRGLFSRGQGGDRGANQHGKFEAKSQGVILPAAGGGFQAKLQAELGLHPEQARRLEERADYVRRLRIAAAGNPVKYITGTGKAKREETFEPSAQAAKMARASLDAVLVGDVPPSRAWAGVVGEGKRVAKSGKKERAAVDHAMNISNAIAKLKTSLPHWRKLDPQDRADIETEFIAMKDLLKGTLL